MKVKMKKLILFLFPAIMLFGGIPGCSDSKGPGSTISAVHGDGTASIPDTAQDKKTVKENHKVTFVELGSITCIPCKMMQPVMKAIEKEFGSQVKILFHDVWTPQGKQDGMKYNIRVIPTQVFLDSDGKEYFRHEGFFPREEVVKVLKLKGVL